MKIIIKNEDIFNVMKKVFSYIDKFTKDLEGKKAGWYSGCVYFIPHNKKEYPVYTYKTNTGSLVIDIREPRN